MKYVMQNGALFSLSESNWKNYCKSMASGIDVDLPGKLLEFDLIEISKWDRDDYAKAIGLEEVPSDLPTEKQIPTKRSATSKRSKTGRATRSNRGKTT